MADRTFEHYKDTLRRGHLAALRGELEEAVAAYREAAEIAPDRAIPLTSLGGALRRLGNAEDALAAFERALEIAPSDALALAGRAELLGAAERSAPAAEAYLALAEVHLAEDRPDDASEAARHALDALEQPDRRGSMGRLVGRFRAAEPDAASAQLAERARDLLARAGGSDGDRAPAAPAEQARSDAAPASVGQPATVLTSGAGHSNGSVAMSGAVAGTDPQVAPVPAPEEAAISTPDPLDLILAAERAVDAGDANGAVTAYLGAASGLAGELRWRAALDACAQALAIAPSDGRLHLDMAELYLAAGWTDLAAEKLRLVARLAELDDDPATRERVCTIVRVWLADDPALAALCP